MLDNLYNLASYGIAGVAIALIILIAYLGKMVKEIIVNHMQHNNDVINKLENTIRELLIFLKGKNGSK